MKAVASYRRCLWITSDELNISYTRTIDWWCWSCFWLMVMCGSKLCWQCTCITLPYLQPWRWRHFVLKQQHRVLTHSTVIQKQDHHHHERNNTVLMLTAVWGWPLVLMNLILLHVYDEHLLDISHCITFCNKVCCVHDICCLFFPPSLGCKSRTDLMMLNRKYLVTAADWWCTQT